ncbi:MAG: peptide deformylase [Spirochaetales bacterium]|nr:peptide deformylase [Spirochaetales bacterium]
MLDIITLGNETLRKKALPVENFNGELAALVEQMAHTMILEKGIGLAAPQVGLEQRIFVCSPDQNDLYVFINPEIVETSEGICPYEEGCLSIPGVYADVVRPEKITVQAYSVDGKPFTIQADDILARVIQHEYDHLQGVLFIDRISERKREKLIRHYEKIHNLKKA